MKLDLFKRIVDETCSGVTSYSLFGDGESLLVTDFEERLKYVSKRKSTNATIDLVTNGMLLTEDTSKLLIDCDVEVSISFDGSSAGLFERIRRGSNLERIGRNIERISTIASQMNPFRAPGIGISIQKENWNDLVDIVKTSNNLGVKRASMWPVVNPERFRLEPNIDVMKEIANAIYYAEDKGMAVDMYPIRLGKYIWDGSEYTGIDNSFVNTNCNAPFICTSIAWNGDVCLCCNYGDTVENIGGKSFQEVWEGEKYEKLRRRVNHENNLPKSCRNCFWVNRY
jgi:radical SAM protein with 4Fe4S-binding SPASM domain